jgi:hypothetical protein
VTLALGEEEDPPGLRRWEELVEAGDGAWRETVGRHAVIIV